MNQPSLATQAILACLASAANYLSESDPSAKRKPEVVIKKPVDRIWNSLDKKELHWKLIVGASLSVRVLSFVQPLYLAYISLSGKQPTFPTFRAAPFFLLSIIGVSWRVWCFRTLDKYFTFRLQVQRGHQIIQTGPYRFLAHPSYLGIFANSICVSTAIIGPLSPWLNMFDTKTLFTIKILDNKVIGSQRSIAQVVASLFGITTFLHGLWLLCTRIADEERMLREHFGKEYDQFLSTRWRVLPFIY